MSKITDFGTSNEEDKYILLGAVANYNLATRSRTRSREKIKMLCLKNQASVILE